MTDQPSDENITMAVWDILKGDLDISRNELKAQIESVMGWNLENKKVGINLFSPRSSQSYSKI